MIFDSFNSFFWQHKGLFIGSFVILMNIHFIYELLFLFLHGKTSRGLYYENEQLKEENKKLKDDALRSLSEFEKIKLLSLIFSNFNSEVMKIKNKSSHNPDEKKDLK